MKIYIIAGEPSGDLHGGNLITALKKYTPTPDIRGWGGHEMERAGAHIVKHYNTLAFMGFVEVIKNLIPIFKNFQFARKDITKFNPDILILIDYPGFNLKMAKWAFKKNIPVTYYILPQIWAWHESRIKYLEKYTQIRLAILPFEKSYFLSKHLQVHYVGHPLVQHIQNFKNASAPLQGKVQSTDKSIIVVALLPGSRKQEISKHIPLLLPLVLNNPALNFEMAQAPGLSDELFHTLINPQPTNLSFGKNTYQILSRAQYAIVCSGTATLETALFNVPQIVFYRTNFLNYLLAKWLVKVRFISLVNLILQKPLVQEIVNPIHQGKALAKSFENLIKMENKFKLMEGYEEFRLKLGEIDTPLECSKIIFNI